MILKRSVVQLQGNKYEQWAFRKKRKKRKEKKGDCKRVWLLMERDSEASYGSSNCPKYVQQTDSWTTQERGLRKQVIQC